MPLHDTNQLMQRAIFLQQAGKFSEAIEIFDEIIGLEPRREGAYNSKGLTLKMAGRPEEAIPCYELALDALCGKLFWSLSNAFSNPIHPWENTPGETWTKWTFKTALYTSCQEQGIKSVGWPTGESAEVEARTRQHGGLLWIDSQEEVGILRLFLPNYFHTMRERLKATKTFSRVLNNIGGALLAMNKLIEGSEKLYEAIAFIPDGDDYDDPCVALYQIQKHN